MKSQDNILSLINKNKLKYHPLFSGLISVIEAGLGSEGLQFHETYHDAVVMTRVVASTYRISVFRDNA